MTRDDVFADPSAERIVLSAAICDPTGARDEWARIPPDAWWNPQHEVIAQAITGLYERDLLADLPGEFHHERVVEACLKVTEAAVASDGSDQRRETITRLVHDLGADLVGVAMMRRYVDRLCYLAHLRSMKDSAVHFLQRLEERHYVDDEQDLSAAIHDLRSTLDEVEADTAATDDADHDMLTLSQLLAGEIEYRWLIPGLFERGDRMILTGWEGAGKSELLHQFATCVAGQVHPFTGWPLPPKEDGSDYRSMVVDCENSQGQLMRRLRRQAARVDRVREQNDMPPMDWRHLAHRLWVQPDGIELADARDVARLSHRLKIAAPDLLIIGPLYKLTDTDLNEGSATKAVLVALDRLRVRHDCAMIVEHHPGHALAGPKSGRSIRPSGSAYLMRWPEFGRGLMPEDQKTHGYSRMILGQWRADREERVFPDVLVRGGTLPWSPGHDSYYADVDSFTANM